MVCLSNGLLKLTKLAYSITSDGNEYKIIFWDVTKSIEIFYTLKATMATKRMPNKERVEWKIFYLNI